MALRALALAVALAACGARGDEVTEPAATVVDEAPPPPVAERVELRPGSIWVRGRWQLRGGRWRWQPGRYQRARDGLDWIDGHWQLEGDRYRWIEGRWRAARGRR